MLEKFKKIINIIDIWKEKYINLYFYQIIGKNIFQPESQNFLDTGLAKP